ncbi:MAG: YvcK family protein [Acidimicrobiia bacterium]|nr:YvcK family protein [Acidimicrobiia bacterium]
MESNRRYFNHRVTVLAGGVGGAKMARALRSVLAPGTLSIVVNVGDDTRRYGVHIAADPDTVLYTLSGTVGPHGWGRADDTTNVMSGLSELGVDTTFTLGDKDFGLCAHRTTRLDAGEPLSSITADLARRFGLTDIDLLPATDDPLATVVRVETGETLDFQTYFVDRRHTDEVVDIDYLGAPDAKPAPGVVDAIVGADVVVIAPSNPPLSIHPILAVEGIRDAVAGHPRVAAVSPLFGGIPLKGPADVVMRGLGYAPGTLGVLEAYEGLLDMLWVDVADTDDVALGDAFGVSVVPANTRLDGHNGGVFATSLLTQALGPDDG